MSRITLGFIAALALAAPAHAEDTRPVLTVQGTGTTKAKPDLAKFSAAVTTRAPDLKGASDGHGDRAAKAVAVLNDLKGKGVKIAKSTFSLRQERTNENYPPPPGTKGARETEGVAVTRFDVEVRPVDGIDDVVTALALTGLFEVQPVAYVLDDPKAETDKARNLAMRDAMEQAKVFSQAGGFKVGEIVNVTAGMVQVMDAYMQASGQAMRTMAAPMQAAAPATIDTQSTVGVTWRIVGGEDK